MKLKMTIVPLFTRSFAYILLLLSSLIILSTTLQAASILNANTMQMAGNIDLTGDDDVASIQVPIGFNFSFFSQNKTQFSVNTNGVVFFGTPNTSYEN